MTPKWPPQGGLIYLTMATFLVAAILLRNKKQQTLGHGVWFAGFVAAVVSVAYRWVQTKHWYPPMQNLFEFFLCMAAALWPLSLLSKKQTGLDTRFQDALLGVLILFPAGFVFKEGIRQLPPALQSHLFVPHVGSYVAAYIVLARAAFMALPMLWAAPSRVRQLDAASRQTAAMGFVLLTLGLLLGSLWGKICWGHYWQWDPKEMWSLATWFVYGAYFHYRLKNGVRNPRVLSILLLLGLLFIILTLTWINISSMFKGVHSYA
ncbi:MAG: cytochrome c biogenesis protein [Kiritimatiellaeota bacterium]|nr:cytochrome c biogenesis protein [Kiritimatiellota bacterium]